MNKQQYIVTEDEGFLGEERATSQCCCWLSPVCIDLRTAVFVYSCFQFALGVAITAYTITITAMGYSSGFWLEGLLLIYSSVEGYKATSNVLAIIDYEPWVLETTYNYIQCNQFVFWMFPVLSVIELLWQLLAKVNLIRLLAEKCAMLVFLLILGYFNYVTWSYGVILHEQSEGIFRERPVCKEQVMVDAKQDTFEDMVNRKASKFQDFVFGQNIQSRESVEQIAHLAGEIQDKVRQVQRQGTLTDRSKK